MTVFWQDLINGLFLGGGFALFAVGLTLSLGVLRVVNMAHGVTLGLSAVAALKVLTVVSLPFPLLVVFGGLVGAAIGVLLEFIAFRPLRRGLSERTIEMTSLVSSLAVLLMLQAVAQEWTASSTLAVPGSVFHVTEIHIGPFEFRSILLVMLVVALVLVGITWWAIDRTQFGRGVRAVAMDDEAAEMMGVNANVVKLVTLVGSSALAGIAGVLLAVSLGATDYNLGQPQLLTGFAVVILGGIGSIPGALIGGLALGVIEGLTINLFGSSWQEAAPFVALILVLLIRPQGVFGKPFLDRA